MALTSFKDVFITFTIVGIFMFAMISFVFELQDSNGVINTIKENELLNNTFNRLETNLSTFGSQAQTQKDNFESEIPERGFGTLIIFSIVTVAQKFTGMVIAIYNTMVLLPASVLGIPPIVVSGFNAIVLIILVLLSWRVIRLGS